jgi:hypothetical protein
METEKTYYIIESPCGVRSERLNAYELDYFVKEGKFTIFLYVGDTGQIYQVRKLKIGKIYKYTEKTIITEEELDKDTALDELNGQLRKMEDQ